MPMITISANDIARLLGISPHTVRHKLCKRKLKLKPRYTDQILEFIVEEAQNRQCVDKG